MFSGTRLRAEDPLRAAKAYSDITDAVDDAEDSADEAARAAQDAISQVKTFLELFFAHQSIFE